jgi:hypothetical protein
MEEQMITGLDNIDAHIANALPRKSAHLNQGKSEVSKSFIAALDPEIEE